MHIISISDTGNEVSIELRNYEESELNMEEELKWINGTISIKGPPFQGEFDGSFLDSDFKRFREELVMLLEKKNLKATFSCLEKWLYIEIVSSDELGHFSVFVSAQCNSSTLSFSFESEFSQILKIEKELNFIK